MQDLKIENLGLRDTTPVFLDLGGLRGLRRGFFDELMPFLERLTVKIAEA